MSKNPLSDLKGEKRQTTASGLRSSADFASFVSTAREEGSQNFFTSYVTDGAVSLTETDEELEVIRQEELVSNLEAMGTQLQPTSLPKVNRESKVERGARRPFGPNSQEAFANYVSIMPVYQERLQAVDDDRYKGDWSEAAAYASGDYVTYGTALFFCLQSNRSQHPGREQFWKMMAGPSGGGGGGGGTSITTDDNLIIRRSGVEVEGKIRPHENVEFSAVALTAGAPTAYDMSAGWIATLQLTAGSQSMGNPTNVIQYSSGKIYLDFNGQTGFTWASNWDWDGSPPVDPGGGKGLLIGWDAAGATNLVVRVFAEYTL